MSAFSSLLSSLGVSTSPSNPTESLPRPNVSKPDFPRPTLVPAATQPTAQPQTTLKRKRDGSPNKSLAKRTTDGSAADGCTKAGNIPSPRTTQTLKSSEDAPSSSVPQRPPPKGSYREIMARAASANAASLSVGQIKHKAVVKAPRLSRAAQVQTKEPVHRVTKKASTQRDRPSFKKLPQTGKVKALANNTAAKPKRMPLQLEYKGTMRPTNGNTKTNSSQNQPSLPSQRIKQSQGRGMNNSSRPYHSRYDYDDDKEDDEDEEDLDGDDMSSDESESRAGGGFDELMAEEEESLRVARREDEAARRQEVEHAREKAARRDAPRRLAESRKGRK